MDVPRHALSWAFRPNATWPANVPSMEHALSALRGDPGTPAPLQHVTEQLRSGLSSAELAALTKSGPANDALLSALGCRWRIALAQSLRPHPPASVDTAALDALFAEIDVALAELKRVASANPLTPAVEPARKGLVTSAIAFSEFVQSLNKQVAENVAASASMKYPAKVATKILSSETLAPDVHRGDKKRRVTMAVALGFTILGAVAFHGSSLLAGAASAPQAVSNAPAGTLSVSIPGGPEVVSTPDGKPLSEEDLGRLTLGAEARGLTVTVLGPGQYALVPAAPPAAPPTEK